MLRLRVTSDCQPRTKNGQPAHSTTGVASASRIQFIQPCGIAWPRPKKCPPMSRTTTGTDSATAAHSRRVMSTSSWLGPWSSVISSGSSAMPQIGQEPGPSWRISGCIGHVKIVPGFAGAAGSVDLGAR